MEGQMCTLAAYLTQWVAGDNYPIRMLTRLSPFCDILTIAILIIMQDSVFGDRAPLILHLSLANISFLRELSNGHSQPCLLLSIRSAF
jgi:hypothetical protein